MAEKVVAWLEGNGWEVYQEVKYDLPTNQAPVADIVAIKDDDVWVIECKTGLNLTLLMQISRHPSIFRSIAIPSAYPTEEREFGMRCTLGFCEAGVITVTEHGILEKVPAPRRHGETSSSWIRSALRPEHKTFAKAGIRGGGFWTPYKDTMGKVRTFLADHPRSTIKEIVGALGKCHYASERGARQQLRVALTSWESDWCDAVSDPAGGLRFEIRST